MIYHFTPIFFCRLQNRRVINFARAERHVIGHGGMAGEQAGRGAVAHALEVHELPAMAVFFHQFHRVLAGMHDPKNVHLKIDKLRIGLAHDQIQQGAVLIWLKFVAVDVIEKSQTVLREHFTGVIENSNGFAAGFFHRMARRAESRRSRHI